MNVLITGTNRGIGLEFVKQYLNEGHVVIATCRSFVHAGELQQLKENFSEQLIILEIDLQSETSIKETICSLKEQVECIDILINNAGTNAESEKGLQSLEAEAMQQVFTVNTIAPLLVSKYAEPLLRKATKPIIASLFSAMGFLSSTPFQKGTQYSYAASKAALNMGIRQMAVDLSDAGICVIGIGPGFVLTDLTNNAVPPPTLLPKESVKNMKSIISGCGMEDSGKFIENDGVEITTF